MNLKAKLEFTLLMVIVICIGSMLVFVFWFEGQNPLNPNAFNPVTNPAYFQGSHQ